MNLRDHIDAGQLHAVLTLAISTQPDAPAVKRLSGAGVTVHVVDRSQTPDPLFDDRITGLLRTASVDLVCMAGLTCFWRIPDDFGGRVVNIHPALLPGFGGRGFFGMRVHRAVLASGARQSGCTVHYADNQYDHGPVILQRTCPVLADDTPASLAARVFEQEKIAYPQAVGMIIQQGVESFPTSRGILPRAVHGMR